MITVPSYSDRKALSYSIHPDQPADVGYYVTYFKL